MWPEGWDDGIEMQTSGAQLKRPTKATAPPPSVILGTFANRNTHYKSGPGSNGRGSEMPHSKSENATNKKARKIAWEKKNKYESYTKSGLDYGVRHRLA